MMLALTYGMMPSAKIDSCSSAPPVKRLKRLRKPPDASMAFFITTRFRPGAVTNTPPRSTARQNRVKSSRLRSSAILKRFPKAFAKDTTAPCQGQLNSGLGLGGLLFYGLALLRRGLGRDDDLLHLAAGLLDLLAGGGGELVRLHRHGLGQLAVAQDLEAVLAHLDGAGRNQLVQVHFRHAERLEIAHVDQRGLHPERVGDPALGDPPLDGHLPTLEADEVHVAGAGLLPLAAAAGGLAGAAGLAAPHPLLLFHSATARRRQPGQFVHLKFS